MAERTTEPYAVWLDRDVVGVTGPESGVFLQGQLSQDVLLLGEGTSAWSWVLAPTGKVDALVRVTRRRDDSWLLDTDGGWGPPLLTRLNRFKLRTKAELELLPWKVVGLRFGRASGGDIQAAFDWPTLPGVDLLGPSVHPLEGWRVAPLDEYEAARIVAGFPKMGAELSDKTIPAETGLNDRTVSFSKGCYTGQELVARIDSRGGNVPRHLRGLRMASRVEPATELVDVDGKAAGTVTSVAQSQTGGWVGLGYVRRAVEVPATLHAGPDGPAVKVGELPR